ncbi:5482_t:CDS:2 [Ambispora gerdemannii]|uniref:5482_t:CDS:1 n=1 Tax=Ambispora gerdemannii TaxID=144530 RepID=A0A9N9FBG2_9GLOM|nr:5482_t:CDS:2 [Ambispora gerdemannii]
MTKGRASVVIAIVLIVSMTTLLSSRNNNIFVDGSPVLAKRGKTFSGEATYYNPGLGSCGKNSANTDMVVAINKPQWGNPANPNKNKICGKKIRVKGPIGSVTAKLVDMCPECPYGNLDLSPSAFDKIAKRSAGRVRVTWKYL